MSCSYYCSLPNFLRHAQLVTVLFYGKTRSIGKQVLWQSHSGENYWGRKDCRCFGYISVTFSISRRKSISSEVWYATHTGINTHRYRFASKILVWISQLMKRCGSGLLLFKIYSFSISNIKRILLITREDLNYRKQNQENEHHKMKLKEYKKYSKTKAILWFSVVSCFVLFCLFLMLAFEEQERSILDSSQFTRVTISGKFSLKFMADHNTDIQQEYLLCLQTRSHAF